MALLHKPDFGNWTLSGSSYYPNPIQVIVRTPSVQVDVYEPNDAENNAANLNLSFVGNSASVNTSGSNSDNGSDYDYYNINLPTGYEYILTARVHDSYNSGNGQVYTNDVLWSYTDGSFWSMAYDDIMLGNIVISNGGNVKFLVAPYFLGETGTYLLDIQAVRTPLGIEDELSNSSLTIFPNPVNNILNIDGVSNVNSVQILDISGRGILQIDNFDESGIGYSIPLAKLEAGTYIVNIKSDDGTYQRKFIKTE